MEYLEIIAQNGHILNFTYKSGRGSFTLDLNNAVEMFTISDFKRFFAIADESNEGAFAIAEKVQAFTAARLEYEKTFTGCVRNEKLISKLEKILLFLADSFGISCDVEKPEKITKKRGTGLIFNVDASGRRFAEAVTGDFYKVGGIWYFIHKKPEIKRGGYVLSAAAYGSRVAAFGYFKTAKEAIAWITENGISKKLLNPPAEGKARAAEMRARFLETVENSGLSWVIESNPAYFEDFMTTAEAETPAERTEKPQNATESTTAARIARTTRHKPHISPKTARGYISTIDGTKALKRANYTPTGESPGKPAFNRFSKNGNPWARNGTFETSIKICGYFEKIRVGFHIGLSPPVGYQKFSL